MTTADVASSVGSWAKQLVTLGGIETDPLWRRILDKISGLWLMADGLGTFFIIAGALYVGIVHGIWGVGVAVIIFELFGMCNSFYAAHRVGR